MDTQSNTTGQSYDDFLLDIANNIDRRIRDKSVKAIFQNQMDKLCKMVEDYWQAQQPYIKQYETAKKQPAIKEKFTPEQLEKYKISPERLKQLKLPSGAVQIPMDDICPPPKGYIKTSYFEYFFINIPIDVIYRPPDSVNPLLWFSKGYGVHRLPDKAESLMVNYVLLGLIHDEICNCSTDNKIYNNYGETYSNKHFQFQEFQLLLEERLKILKSLIQSMNTLMLK
ncbi:MAG: hypothetical protein ABSA76_12970 [Bacteroidales bacterium]